MQKILVVEDDLTIIKFLTDFLKQEGYYADSAEGQKEALQKFEDTEYDLVLMDISLKDGNGFVVCSALKQIRDVPVIFLTASDDEHSVVAGLDMGADDYISKPFRPRELISRIRTVLRRSGKSQKTIEIGNICVDTEKGAVYKNGTDLCLSALEYRLFLVLLSNRGAVFSRSRLLEEIWDVAGDFVNDNTLTVYIKRLRDKVEDDPQNPIIIKTIRGLGYKIGE